MHVFRGCLQRRVGVRDCICVKSIEQVGTRAGRAPFDVFVRARSDGLVGLACLVTRDWSDAQDAVQDALLALYPGWSKLPEGPDLQRYVNRAVVNSCLKILRRRRRMVPVEDVAWVPGAGHSVDPASSVVLARWVWLMCAELPPVQRAAVALRFHEDLDYAEIGRVLGCAEATARSHVHRAITALRVRSLEGEHHG